MATVCRGADRFAGRDGLAVRQDLREEDSETHVAISTSALGTPPPAPQRNRGGPNMVKRALAGVFCLAWATAFAQAPLPPPATPPNRSELSLNGTWEQIPTTRDAALKPPADGWQPAQAPALGHGPALGGSQYILCRHEITPPQDWAGQRIFLRLEGARYHPHGFVGEAHRRTPRRLDAIRIELTNDVRPGEARRILRALPGTGRDLRRRVHAAAENGRRPPRRTQGQSHCPDRGPFRFLRHLGRHQPGCRSPTYLDDIAIVTSVRRQTLTVTGTVCAPGRRPQRAGNRPGWRQAGPGLAARDRRRRWPLAAEGPFAQPGTGRRRTRSSTGCA